MSAPKPVAVPDAIAHADLMLRDYHLPRAVFVRKGPDQYGREDVVYVREPDDPEMLAEVNAGRVVTVYVAR